MSVETAFAVEAIRNSQRAGAAPDLNGGILLYGLTFVPVTLFLAMIWFQPFFPIAELLRDPLAVAELSKDCCHVHYGAVSNGGVLIWFSSAAILLFSALVLTSKKGWDQVTRFLTIAGLLTAWLTLDDFFLIHEDVLPKLGVPEPVTYAAYASFGLAYLALSYRQILQHRYVMLGLAMGFLGMSAGIDFLFHSASDLRLFIEDGAKLLGITAWFSFHVEAAYREVS